MNAGLISYQEKLKAGEVVKSKRPSMKRAILAKCKDCMCNYVDGRLDCGVESCSLYFWMPYGKLKKRKNELSEISN